MDLERKKRVLWNLLFWGAMLGLCWLALHYLLAWMLPFLLGFLIAYLLRPVAGFIRRHSRMGPRGAAIVPAVLLYLILGAALWALGFVLVIQAQKLGDWLPEVFRQSVKPFLERAGQWAEAQSPRLGAGAGNTLGLLSETLESAAASASQWGVRLLGSLMAKLPLFALTVVFTVLSSVLICAEYDGVVDFVLRQIPDKLRPILLETRDFLLKTVGKVLKTYLILMLLTFVQLAAGLWLLKAPSWLAVAAVIAVLDLLPVLGSGVVLVPWGVWKLAAGDFLLGGGLLALWVVVSAVRQVLEPKILGDQIGLPPLAALTAMYLGLRLAGVWGLVFAPVLCLLLRHLHDNGTLRLYR